MKFIIISYLVVLLNLKTSDCCYLFLKVLFVLGVLFYYVNFCMIMTFTIKHISNVYKSKLNLIFNSVAFN